MAGRLEGKVVMITGAGGGIGSAGAMTFAAQGARIAVAEIDEARGLATARAIEDSGGESVFVRTDVTDSASVQTALSTVRDVLGPLNVLYNNAGYSMEIDADIANVAEEVWKETSDVVLYGSFLCAKYAMPAMIENGGGVIISTASVAGVSGMGGSTAYPVAKAGVIALTRNIAAQYADRGIRANCISPGLTMSPRLRERVERQTALGQRVGSRQALGYCDPQDIANAALFLASDESRMITGQNLIVDGGYVIGAGAPP